MTQYPTPLQKLVFWAGPNLLFGAGCVQLAIGVERLLQWWLSASAERTNHDGERASQR